MNKFSLLKSKPVLFLKDNIDTDQIIPARFLKIVDKNGLGEKFLYNFRYTSKSKKKNFILNRIDPEKYKILIVGKNFGIGSSREHAVWACLAFGIKIIIAQSFGDIFYNNCLKNGLLPIKLDVDAYKKLICFVKENPDKKLEIDLKNQRIRLTDKEKIYFEIDQFRKKCLLEGIDELDYLLKLKDKIKKFERLQKVNFSTKVSQARTN